MLSLPTYEDVHAAARRLHGVAHRTPVLTSASIDREIGAHLYFKCENLQRAGAFKFRGAYNAVALLNDPLRRAGVVTFSSGNHGQALALAARLHGVAATIVMPHDAPTSKIAATRAYGGEVVFYDRHREDREALAREHACRRGFALVPPFDHPHVIAGQGTAALELIEATGPLDFLFAPLGGGGLLAGSALAARELAPDCRVIGVEPEQGDDGRQSLRSGRVVTIAVPDTIADGARTTRLGEYTFGVMRAHVNDVMTVSDRAVIAAMRLLAERLKLVVEPTGALAAAAVLGGSVPLQGRRVGILLSGGNVDAETFGRLMAQ